MTNRTREIIEQKHGPLRTALLSQLATKTPRQIGREWGIHYNTILIWMDEEGIERRVTYVARDRETAGAAG